MRTRMRTWKESRRWDYREKNLNEIWLDKVDRREGEVERNWRKRKKLDLTMEEKEDLLKTLEENRRSEEERNFSSGREDMGTHLSMEEQEQIRVIKEVTHLPVAQVMSLEEPRVEEEVDVEEWMRRIWTRPKKS